MYDLYQGGGRPSSQSEVRPRSSADSTAGQAKLKSYKKYDDVRFQDLDLANEIADAMRGPEARLLTKDELQWCGTGFGVMTDISNVAIINGPGNNVDAMTALNIMGNPAITEGDNIYFRKDRYLKDFGDRTGATFADNVDVLLHEYTHVYQYQKMGFFSFFVKYGSDLGSFGGKNEVYRYNKRQLPFNHESLEGQAEMVGHYANYLAGGQPNNSDTRSTIEKKLKSTGIFML